MSTIRRQLTERWMTSRHAAILQWFTAFAFNPEQLPSANWQRQRSAAVRGWCQSNSDDDWQRSWRAASCSQCRRSRCPSAACYPSSTATCHGTPLARLNDSQPHPTTASPDAYHHLQPQNTFRVIIIDNRAVLEGTLGHAHSVQIKCQRAV